MYVYPREELILTLDGIHVEHDVNILIRGSTQLNEDDNTALYYAALKFIADSGRFTV